MRYHRETAPVKESTRDIEVRSEAVETQFIDAAILRLRKEVQVWHGATCVRCKFSRGAARTAKNLCFCWVPLILD